MDIFLHQGRYEGDTDNEYTNMSIYKLWIKHTDEGIFVIKQDKSSVSKRQYKHINEFFNHWGMIFRDCNQIKLN